MLEMMRKHKWDEDSASVVFKADSMSGLDRRELPARGSNAGRSARASSAAEGGDEKTDSVDSNIGLQDLVEEAVLLYRRDVDWALRLGMVAWGLSALSAAAWASAWPRLMWVVAVVGMWWATLASDLCPIKRGPLTWLVHFLVVSGAGKAKPAAASV
jgi:hypothetical protein